MNARIVDFYNAIQGESTAAGCSGVFLEIAVIPRRVDEFVRGVVRTSASPIRLLGRCDKAAGGKSSAEDMAPAPETTDSGDHWIRSGVRIEQCFLSVHGSETADK